MTRIEQISARLPDHTAALICALGLGFSVALRKKGHSKLSFAVQFAGVAAIALTVLLHSVCTGTLVKPLN